MGRKLREWWKIETFEEEEPQGENWRWGAKGGGGRKQLLFRGETTGFLMLSKGRGCEDGEVTIERKVGVPRKD